MRLAEADRRMGLTQAAADAIGDDRRRKSVVHATRDIIRQRVYGLLLGHEDLNDHGRLRLDPALQANRRFANGKLRFPQAAVMRDGAMASPSTLCRFERKSTPWEALKPRGAVRAVREGAPEAAQAHRAGLRRHRHRGASHADLHGMQEGRHWHGHYRFV